MNLIERIREKTPNLSVGINAANFLHLQKDIETLEKAGVDFLHFDVIYVLGINPGWGGQSFIPSVKDKFLVLKEILKETQSSALMVIDGGINKNNITKIADLKPDLIVSGSAVFKNGMIKENFSEMLAAIKNQ